MVIKALISMFITAVCVVLLITAALVFAGGKPYTGVQPAGQGTLVQGQPITLQSPPQSLQSGVTQGIQQ